MRGKLVLENGKTFSGKLLSDVHAAGEVVFNTAMVGYQEILTDPSYFNQIVTLTYPLVGNYGAAEKFNQSNKTFVSGLIVSQICQKPSNWEMETSLEKYLIEKNIPCLYDVDTRAITRHVRSAGTMRGIIVSEATSQEKINEIFQEAASKDAVKKVTTPKTYHIPADGHRVVVLDLGVKQNILNALNMVGCDLTVVPADTGAAKILALNPRGIFLSNGPGNPKDAPEIIKTVKELIGKKPIFGIGLGHQILALALGGDTSKLKFGHRGSNHPVQEIFTGSVHISSQNHGYAIDEKSLEGLDITITHKSLNDGTIEGIKHNSLPIFSVQYHPETSVNNPDNNSQLFSEFVQMLNKEQRGV
jgi:carbamoyl-phosphate synthase small subunit